MNGANEFSRVIKLDRLPAEAVLSASAEERAALAQRFGLPAIKALSATITLAADGSVVTTQGRLVAQIEQNCAVSGEAFASSIDEAITLRFVPAGTPHSAESDEEGLELETDELDEIEYDGASFDLGEAVAQSLALAIDPYATGPEADRVRKQAGIMDEDAPKGPFAALAALKKN